MFDLVDGPVTRGTSTPPDPFDAGRRSAALALVEGYETALACLSPQDVKERRWYARRLRDWRIIAGLPPAPIVADLIGARQ